MGTCPHCRAVTLPGDAVCYTCGRFLKGQGTDYAMPNAPMRRGTVVANGRTKNIMRRRKNHQRSLLMLAFVVFAFLSPQAREAAFGSVEGLDSYVARLLQGSMIYPMEAEFTVMRSYEVENNLERDGMLVETVRLPVALPSVLLSPLEMDGSEPVMLQRPIGFTVSVGSERVNVPLDGSRRERAEAWTSLEGHEVWWPTTQPNSQDHCPIATCVKVRLNMDPGERVQFTTESTVSVTSHTWWDAARVDDRVPGKEHGINVDTSGTFDDIAQRGGGLRSSTFGAERWYALGDGYAIDAQHAEVIETANAIAMRLPEGRENNAYAFARAAFDWMHENVPYDKEAATVPRTGPTCLADRLGDCDEQTNAFLSVVRTRGIPGWYVFGALVNPLDFATWEMHAWGYIMLPLDSEWCAAQGVLQDNCYVEGSVDVVNNKWLLHTTNAYIDWLEEPDPSGQAIADAYSSAVFTGSSIGETPISRVMTISSGPDVQLNGGTFSVSQYPEDLR
jgi:hypothetical protein